MNILFLNLEFPPIGQGAAARHSAFIKALVKEYGVTGTLITSSPDHQDHIEEAAPGVKMIRLNVGKKKPYFWTAKEVGTFLIKASSRLNTVMKEEKFDICHSFFGFPCGLLAYKWRKQLPYIIFLTGVDVPGPGTRLSKLQPILSPIYKQVWGKAGALVANSADLQARALKAFPKMDVKIIHNGVDTDIFQPAAQLPDGQKMLCVARLQVHKNIHLIIEAISKLKDQYPNMHLNVVGDGPEHDRLADLIKAYQLENNVILSGYQQRSAMPDIYRQANCFLLLSEWEGMSNGLLEAMASGLPVIVSNVGGASQLVHDNGLIVNEVSATSIAESLDKIFQEQTKLSFMGEASRQKAEEMSCAKAATKIMDLSNEVLSRH